MSGKLVPQECFVFGSVVPFPVETLNNDLLTRVGTSTAPVLDLL